MKTMKLFKLFVFVSVFFIPHFAFSMLLPDPDYKVRVCKNTDGTNCIDLQYDVEDLDDVKGDDGNAFGDRIKYIEVDPYTSVVLYENDNFKEDVGEFNLETHRFNATEEGYVITNVDLEALGLDTGNGGIDSIKVHPQANIDCYDYDSIDECLKEYAKPILIYDQNGEDCNTRGTKDGQTAIKARVDTDSDGNYKMVSYQIWHENDCGMDMDGAELYGDLVTTTMDSIRDELEEEMGESFDSCGSFDGFWDAVWFFDEAWDAIGCVLDYLANAAVWLSTHVIEGVSDTLSGITDVMNFTEFLVSAHDGDGETTRYLFKRVDADNGVYWALTAARYHHHNTVSTKYHGDIPWPLRIHISKNKHAQYPSKWVCENATYADGAEPEVLERLEGADEFNNTYEDCDGWHLNEDLSYPVEGDNGGEVLYPEDYALNDLDEDFTSYTGDFCNAGGRDVGIEEDCDLNTDLVTSGMVFLDHWESGEQEEVDVGDDDPDPYDPLDMNPQNIFSYGQSDYHGSYNDINLYSYYLQSGSNLTARTADSITVSDFIVGNGASVSLKYGTNGGDRVVLSPFFWAQEGSELTISSSTYFPFK